MGCGCGKKTVYKVATPEGTKETTDKTEAYRLAGRYGATVTTATITR